MPSTSTYFGGHNGHANETSQLIVTRNYGNIGVSGTGMIGLKIEISPSIELSEADIEYGRKQAVVIPAYCRTVYDVKQYLQSIIDLPRRIRLSFGEFCLRDDQDVGIFACFDESVLIVEATPDIQRTPRRHAHNHPEEYLGIDTPDEHERPPKRRVKSKRVQANLESTPENGHTVKSGPGADQDQSNVGNFLSPEASATSTSGCSQTPRLTKSAKRRFRKQRLQERKAKQAETEDSLCSSNKITETEVTVTSPKKEKTSIKKTKNASPDISSDQQHNGDEFYKSTPLTLSSANSSSATFSGNTTGEFAVPKPKKAQFVGTLETPLRNESEDEMVSSSNKKPRPDTPHAPKVLKNPALFGIPDKLNFSSISDEEFSYSSSKLKPDTPNLPFVSKSPHYNYVNKSALNQLSKDMVRNLKLEEAKTQENKRKRGELVEKLNKSWNDVRREQQQQQSAMPSTEEPSQMEVITDVGVHDDLDGKESRFDGLENVATVEELREGDIIAFKITQLNEDNCPVISPYKEARVKSLEGSFLQLEYLRTDSIEPTLLEIEGYELTSTNNPTMIDFSWMISPRRVAT